MIFKHTISVCLPEIYPPSVLLTKVAKAVLMCSDLKSAAR